MLPHAYTFGVRGPCRVPRIGDVILSTSRPRLRTPTAPRLSPWKLMFALVTYNDKSDRESQDQS